MNIGWIVVLIAVVTTLLLVFIGLPLSIAAIAKARSSKGKKVPPPAAPVSGGTTPTPAAATATTTTAKESWWKHKNARIAGIAVALVALVVLVLLLTSKGPEIIEFLKSIDFSTALLPLLLVVTFIAFCLFAFKGNVKGAVVTLVVLVALASGVMTLFGTMIRSANEAIEPTPEVLVTTGPIEFPKGVTKIQRMFDTEERLIHTPENTCVNFYPAEKFEMTKATQTYIVLKPKERVLATLSTPPFPGPNCPD